MKSFVRAYEKDAVIFSEGDTANAAYILSEGCVEISVGTEEKKSVLTVLHPVAVFGEMALLLKEQKRTARAVALSFSKVAEIRKRDFDDFIDQSPKLISAVLKVLVERLQKTTQLVMKSPDLFLATSEVIHLLSVHTVRMVKFDKTISMIRADQIIKSVSDALRVKQSDVKKTLDNLETLGLIGVTTEGDQRYIEVLRKEEFLERCYKIHETFSKLGVSNN